jgi:hypothetical protein
LLRALSEPADEADARIFCVELFPFLIDLFITSLDATDRGWSDLLEYFNKEYNLAARARC